MIEYIGNNHIANMNYSFFRSKERLSIDVLAEIPEELKADKCIIAAPTLGVSKELLEARNIYFLKIGRDVPLALFSGNDASKIIKAMGLAHIRIETKKMNDIVSLIKDVRAISPTMRVAQLIYYAAAFAEWRGMDIQYLSDDVLIEGLKAILKAKEKVNK